MKQCHLQEQGWTYRWSQRVRWVRGRKTPQGLWSKSNLNNDAKERIYRTGPDSQTVGGKWKRAIHEKPGEHVHTTMYDQQGLLCSGGTPLRVLQWPTWGRGREKSRDHEHVYNRITALYTSNSTAGQLLSLSCVRSVAPGWQAPGSSARHCLLARLKLTSIQSVMPSNHLRSIIKYI